MLDINQVCEHFGVPRETVLAWIGAGELAAVNVAPPSGKRKRWRVSPEALSEFTRKRSNQPANQPLPIRLPTKKYV
jgi:excisionase family DNA binding protein